MHTLSFRASQWLRLRLPPETRTWWAGSCSRRPFALFRCTCQTHTPTWFKPPDIGPDRTCLLHLRDLTWLHGPWVTHVQPCEVSFEKAPPLSSRVAGYVINPVSCHVYAGASEYTFRIWMLLILWSYEFSYLYMSFVQHYRYHMNIGICDVK